MRLCSTRHPRQWQRQFDPAFMNTINSSYWTMNWVPSYTWASLTLRYSRLGSRMALSCTSRWPCWCTHQTICGANADRCNTTVRTSRLIPARRRTKECHANSKLQNTDMFTGRMQHHLICQLMLLKNWLMRWTCELRPRYVRHCILHWRNRAASSCRSTTVLCCSSRCCTPHQKHHRRSYHSRKMARHLWIIEAHDRVFKGTTDYRITLLLLGYFRWQVCMFQTYMYKQNVILQ